MDLMKFTRLQWLAVACIVLTPVLAFSADQSDLHNAPADANGSSQPAPGGAPPLRATDILGLCGGGYARADDGNQSDVNLQSMLWVVVRNNADPPASELEVVSPCNGVGYRPGAKESSQDHKPIEVVDLDARLYVLFINGKPVGALDPALYDRTRHAIGFQLARTDKNADFWRNLLASPNGTHRTVAVSLGLQEGQAAARATIAGVEDKDATFALRVFYPWKFFAALIVVLIVIGLVIGTARVSSVLRDNLLPQLPPRQQPYSLGRFQMAFWFVLILSAFLFVYVLLGDYNTISSQALILMGISSTTALASVAVDVAKDSPADAANRTLQSLGVHTYADILRIQSEIEARRPLVDPAKLKSAASRAALTQATNDLKAVQADPTATDDRVSKAKQAVIDAKVIADADTQDLIRLQTEIQDRGNILRMYDKESIPFRSEGFFRDITTDLNGPTVHRLQVVVWTVVLGYIFLTRVYQGLAMPEFSATLLTLMGISGASYVGFKIPEKNN